MKNIFNNTIFVRTRYIRNIHSVKQNKKKMQIKEKHNLLNSNGRIRIHHEHFYEPLTTS